VIVATAQLAGAMSASIIVKVILPGNEVLFDVKLAPGVTVTQGFFLEMFLTFELVFTILMLAAEVCLSCSHEALFSWIIKKTKATFVAPIGIGLALFIGHLVGAFWTGAGSNPARAFGPGVAALSFPNYHWIYCTGYPSLALDHVLICFLGAGPFLGAVIAAAFYRLLKTLRYEDVNGDQDKSADEESLIDAQTSRIETALKRWGSQTSLGQSGLDISPLTRPQRPKSPLDSQGLYRKFPMAESNQGIELGSKRDWTRVKDVARRISVGSRTPYPTQF
jgi:aquaporin related protein